MDDTQFSDGPMSKVSYPETTTSVCVDDSHQLVVRDTDHDGQHCTDGPNKPVMTPVSCPSDPTTSPVSNCDEPTNAAVSPSGGPNIPHADMSTSPPASLLDKPVTPPISHPIFRSDPALWMTYLYREVSVIDVKGQCHRGYVYTVDPVSQSVALMKSPPQTLEPSADPHSSSSEQDSDCDSTSQDDSMFKSGILGVPSSVYLKSGTDIELDIIPGNSVMKINLLHPDSKESGDVEASGTSIKECQQVMDSLFKPTGLSSDSIDAEAVKSHKSNIISWLRKHHIVVEELDDGRLYVCDALYISAPYTYEQCLCTNEIILGRVHGLVKSMPKDISQW